MKIPRARTTEREKFTCNRVMAQVSDLSAKVFAECRMQLSKAVAKSRPQQKGVEGLFEEMLLLLPCFAQFHGKRR